MLAHFDISLDFKLFYKFINDLGNEISILRIPDLNKTKIKSNHYWLQALLGRLPKLRAVKFTQKTGRRLGADFFNFM